MSIGEKIKSIAIELTHISSVVGSNGETVVAQKIYDYFAELDYFKNNPHNLRLWPIAGDPWGRCTILAFVEGTKQAADPFAKVKTVLCLGHVDTAGTDDYGELKAEAIHSDILKEKLQSIQFNDETLSEIHSPDWILGRGIFDMKTGVAALMVMIETFAKHLEQLEGNLVFIGVPDEEGNSAGMLAAVPELAQLAQEKNWDFIVAIDTDYMTDRYPGDTNKYVYVGTVGKLLPCFYVYGEETHVGEAFNGLDANLLSSTILQQMDLNTKLCDVADNEVTLPPISLQQRDLKPEYSVQTTNAVNLYFNYATHSSPPAQVLATCKQIATDSFAEVIVKLNGEYENFCQLSHIPYHPLPWQVAVLTYEELYQAVKAEIGDKLDRLIAAVVAEQQAKQADDREVSLAIIQAIHKNYSNQNSKIIVYFAPPYYPHMFLQGNSEKEKNLLAILEKTAQQAQDTYHYNIVTKKFYPYISDLSYCNISDNAAQLAGLTDNMPAWSRTYTLPIQAIQNISMPVVNIGPYGKDAHKLSERLSCPYSFDAMPFILEQTIAALLK